MATPIDPLHALRLAIKSKSPIQLLAQTPPQQQPSQLQRTSHIALHPTLSLPKSTPTRLRKPTAPATLTDQTSSPRGFCAVDAVYLAWVLKDASVAES